MTAIGSVTTYLMNQILLAFSTTASAVYGVYFKLNSFFFMPLFGLNNAVVPIVAYNYGARNRGRIHQAIRTSTITAVTIMLLGWAAFFFLPVPLLRLFDASEAMIAIGIPAFRITSFTYPLAAVSMDNCSHNGEKLQASVMTVAKAWLEKGYVGQDFIDYLSDESKITFPWSMIDKITPRPHKIVEEQLVKDNIEDMEPIVTSKNTFIAAFVNAERPQYLVVEDKFPNGRPALEKAGVYLTDRETVNKTERMKVTTCLNPLHTAMSVYGCMLGYDLICAEMKDEDIVALIKRLGYVEGLPVVVDPKILDPKAFIDEVIEQRLPNPFMPDMPQRIATDTSQKVGIRFGETIKSYIAEGRDLNSLVSIPLAIAGWLRYLLAIDDNGNAFEVSADPLKDDLQAKLAGIEFGKPETVTDQLDGILSNASIFGTDLTKTVLADKVKAYFKAEIAGPGAVRKTLHEAVNG